MAIVVGLDVHRAQITYDALNTASPGPAERNASAVPRRARMRRPGHGGRTSEKTFSLK
jgi:hypothetical protein